VCWVVDGFIMKQDRVVKSNRAWVVLVTAPGLKPAREIARGLLTGRLAACVNLVPRLESHYWWQEKLETSAEVLLVIKTTRGLLASLAAEVRRLHPYDTPEIVSWPIAAGSRRYLDWLEAAVRPADRRPAP
jgi:periplasmic divalent cation tolerance protein